MNKIILIGHVGKDPENKTTTTGKSVTKFSMATNDYGTTSWHYIEAWDKTADLADKYLKKGSMVAVEGRVKYSVVEKDGKKTTYTSVVADRLEFVGRPHEDGKTETASMSGKGNDYSAFEGEIPF